MSELSIFKDIDEIEILLKRFGARKIRIKKDQLIFSKLSDDGFIGIILYGTVNIVKYDYNGNKIIVDSLEYNSIIGKPFSNFDSDISIIASTDCEILFLDYNDLINDNDYHLQIKKNTILILAEMLTKANERIEILSKRSIREKILCYFNLIAMKRKRKSFTLSITYTELANYLSVDRSAMMRELKKLNQLGLIKSDGKKVTLCDFKKNN